MGPRQSSEQKPSVTGTAGGGGNQVRTGATNSALVNNFNAIGEYMMFGDTSSGVSATPRGSRVHPHQHQHGGSPSRGGAGGQHVTADSAVTPGKTGGTQHQYEPPNVEDGAQQQSQQTDAAISSGDKQPQQQQQLPPRRQVGMKPQTTALCLRYKYQERRSSQNQAPQGSQQKGPPLPPPPQQGVSVELYDKDGRLTGNIPLNASEGEFFTVVDIPTPPPGDTRPITQYFRFAVDGHRGVCHPHLPASPMPNHANDANFVQVFGCEEDSEEAGKSAQQPQTQQQQNQQQPQQQQAPLPNAVHSSSIIHDDEGWGQQAPVFEETRKFPPIMPPHLRYTPLNAPPSNIRILNDKNSKASEAEKQQSQQQQQQQQQPNPDAAAPTSSSPSNMNNNKTNSNSSDNQQQDNTKDRTLTAIEDDSLVPMMLEGSDQRPAPLSVTINHVYFQKREDHTLVGMTTRYQDKCTSIAYYKHDPVPVGAVPLPMPMLR